MYYEVIVLLHCENHNSKALITIIISAAKPVRLELFRDHKIIESSAIQSSYIYFYCFTISHTTQILKISFVASPHLSQS